jgi:hypothetical protein
MRKENEIVLFAMDSRSISERMDCGTTGKYATHWRWVIEEGVGFRKDVG